MPDDKAVQGRDHVLLIGIDAYDGQGASLHGCVNDIDVIQRLLIDKLGIPRSSITRLASPHSGDTHETDVPERLPTLANIRTELERLGSAEVGEQDRVFLYYSGHGAQVPVEEPSGARHVREAIVPKDRVVNLVEDQYLFDWDLNPLLAQIAARTVQVTAIFDCCCSGGVTRDLGGKPGSRARRIVVTKPYRLTADKAASLRGSRRGLTTDHRANTGVCQIIAACLDDETARESDGDLGVCHGELTRAFHAEVSGRGPAELAELRWGRIWRAVLGGVAKVNPSQHPSLFGGFARKVFGGPPEEGEMGFAITRTGDVYAVQTGTLFGVTPGAEIAVYGSEPLVLPPVGSPEDRALRAPRVRVRTAGLSTAEAVAVTAPFDLPKGARARLVKPGKAGQIRVGVAPPNAALAKELGTSPFVVVSGPKEACDAAFVERSDGAWALTDDLYGTGEDPSEPWLVTIPKALLSRAPGIARLYYMYSAPLRLAKNCQDLPLSLRITLHDASRTAGISKENLQNIDFFPEIERGEGAPYELRAGETEAEGVKVCVGVHNDSSEDLRVALLICNNSGRVVVLARAGVPARSSRAFWRGETLGDPMTVTRMEGRAVSLDRVLAIGTTNREIDLTHLQQLLSFEDALKIVPRGGREIAPPDLTRARPELWTSAVTSWRITG